MADAAAALAWVASALGAAKVREVRSLAFGTTSDVRLLDADGEPVVLRRYVSGWALPLAPSLVAAEACALTAASAPLGALVPRALAADPVGTAAGAPAIVTSFLPGSTALAGLELETAATALAALHSAPAPEELPPVQEWLDRKRLAVPEWSRSPHAWSRLIELVRRPAPAATTVFLHRDYHPGNMLWDERGLCGIVDWSFACRGPAAVDVAHMRTNLALVSGPAAADAFLDAYRARVAAYRHHVWWDAVDLFSFDPDFSGVVALNAFGAGLDLATILHRADELAALLATGES
jgi:aminoglycoside phosphotransferase (APT) family kinase protein